MGRGILWVSAALLGVAALALVLRQPPDPTAPASPPASDELAGHPAAASPHPAAPVAPRRPATPAEPGSAIPGRATARSDPDPATAAAPRRRDWFRSPPGRADSPLIHRAWDEHIAPLVHPRNHPRAGEFLDSVTLEDAVRGRVDFEAETLPESYLDTPLREVKKRISPMRVMERTRTWNRKNLESSRAFMEWLLAQPDEIYGPEAKFEILTSPDDPEAYTRRQRFAERIREELAPLFDSQ